jgi:5-methylcytosine-specific restriction protein A
MTVFPKSCAHPGCPAIVRSRYCVPHARLASRAFDQTRPPSSRRGYGGAWRIIRARVLREEPICWCGEPTTEVDHIVPLSAGGTDARENLRALCKRHHSARTRRDQVSR